jgi:hypothetical protein
VEEEAVVAKRGSVIFSVVMGDAVMQRMVLWRVGIVNM